MFHEPWTINHELTNIVVFSIYLLLSIMFKFMVISHLSLVIGTKQADKDTKQNKK